MDVHREKVWIITGVSSGFGRSLLEKVAEKGHTVIGTVRNENQVKAINQIKEGKTFGYLLDIHDHEAIKKMIAHVSHTYSAIDVLVNNAGYGLFGAIEEAEMQDVRKQMETNFFSPLALTQSVLPQMRKQQSGHIIQISSQAGINSSPGLGIYNASKFALEGFSEALYHEVKPLGIHVTIIEPGPFKTNWAGQSMIFSAISLSPYEETAGKMKVFLNNADGNQPGDPAKGAMAIIRMTEEKDPPLRLPLGKIAVGNIRKKIEWVTKEINTWEAVSASTDF